MKRIIVLFVMVSMYHIVLFGQRKYEMVIEKTDGSEVVIKTEDISRTYFREISEGGGNDNQGGGNDNLGGNDSGQIDNALVGVWHCVVYETNSYYTMGWKFDADGNCYYDEWGNSRNEGEWDVPGSWSISNDQLFITWTDEEGSDIETYSYSLSNNNTTLILTQISKNGYTKTYEFTRQ